MTGLWMDLWNYAVQTSAYVRNRCYNRRIKKTAYELFTGNVPNLSKLRKFGSACFAYKQEKGKMESRCDEGVFIGYDKNSPAYLVYYPDTEKVQKHRLVKFTTKTTNEMGTQTEQSHTGYGDMHTMVDNTDERVDENPENAGQSVESGGVAASPEETERIQPGEVTETVTRKNPPRAKRRPAHLQDYDTGDTDDNLNTCVDCCYRAVCDVPHTYQDAIASPKARQWKAAMREEIQSLEENEAFTLTQLPPGKQTVGGRWVYALKNEIDGSDKYKARYVAKGYSQKQGTDYDETFSPTADMTSVRVVMQKAV